MKDETSPSFASRYSSAVERSRSACLLRCQRSLSGREHSTDLGAVLGDQASSKLEERSHLRSQEQAAQAVGKKEEEMTPQTEAAQ